jgi:Ca2+:H+ antiporter
VGLIIPSAFASAVSTANNNDFSADVLRISRATAIMLLVAFFVYLFFQMRSHHGIYDEILEADEMADRDRHEDLKKPKLTFTECILALVLAITFVALIADFLVNEIEFIVTDHHISDA